MQIFLTLAHNMQIWSHHDLVLSKSHADIYYHVIVGLSIELSESRLGICNETRHICLQRMHPIVVPSFHRSDDTLIGSIQSISLPQPCGLGLEAQSGITGSFKEAYIMTTLQRVGFYDLLKKCKYFSLQVS